MVNEFSVVLHGIFTGDTKMSFHFDQQKATQCVAYLVAKAPRQMHSMACLLKILYMLDRKSIAETGVPITGDKPCALPHGMVMSNVYNLAKSQKTEEDAQMEWDTYFKREGNNLRLLLDPGVGRLSRFDRRMLDSVWEEFGNKTFDEMRTITHELPEYGETFNEGDVVKSFPVHLATLLKAVGRRDDYKWLSERKAAEQHFAKLFSGNL